MNMAKKPVAKKQVKKKAASKKRGMRRKKNTLSIQGQFLLVIFLICAVLFAPTTILLLIGMLPTIVAAFVDRTPEKIRGFSIGALNLAACSPYVFELWTSDHTIEQSLRILSDPTTLVFMYLGAAAGYILEWSLVAVMKVFMTERAESRLKAIDKQHAELINRWGKEVTGDIPLDADGFPLEAPENQAAPEKTAQKSG